MTGTPVSTANSTHASAYAWRSQLSLGEVYLWLAMTAACIVEGVMESMRDAKYTLETCARKHAEVRSVVVQRGLQKRTGGTGERGIAPRWVHQGPVQLFLLSLTLCRLSRVLIEGVPRYKRGTVRLSRTITRTQHIAHLSLVPIGTTKRRTSAAGPRGQSRFAAFPTDSQSCIRPCHGSKRPRSTGRR